MNGPTKQDTDISADLDDWLNNPPGLPDLREIADPVPSADLPKYKVTAIELHDGGKALARAIDAEKD